MTSPALTIQPGQSVSRASLQRILETATPDAGMTSSSVYLAPGSGLGALKGLDANVGWPEALAGLDRSVLASDTGIVGLRAGQWGLVILPPFPLAETMALDSWSTAPLMANVNAEYTIGVVLLRLGRSTVALFKGDQLISAKTDARYVKGKHHAGGTSQRRFQRIREGQARKMYDKTCETTRAQLEPHAGELEYLFLGGDRITLNEFVKVCPHVERLRGITLQRRLNIRDPKRDTLEEVPELLRECRLYPVSF